LLGVGVPQTVDRQATVFVADVSASVQDAQPQLATFVTQALNAKRPDDAYAVVSTARAATTSGDEQAALPPPARSCRRPTHRFVFTCDEAAAAAERHVEEVDRAAAGTELLDRGQTAEAANRQLQELWTLLEALL